MNYPYIFFDLDGTLSDPGLGITNAVMFALEKFGITVTDRQSLYKFIGPPLRAAFAEHFGFTPEKAEDAVTYYREYYKPIGLYENEVYPGIEPLLQSLCHSGRTLAVATSKPELFAVRILDHFGLSKYFKAICGCELDGTRGNKDEVILYALGRCGITTPAEVLMIGDRDYDILGAKKAGMDGLGVLYGYGSRQELEDAGAKYIAETVADIGRILL